MNVNFDIYTNAALVISNSIIVDIGESEIILSQYDSSKKIDAKGKIVTPGLVNTHTHSAMTIYRGYADDLPLKIWLEEHIFPVERKYTNQYTTRWGAKLAMAEMIQSGTTTFSDMYYFIDEIAMVAKEIGMRAVLGEGVLDFPTPNFKTPQESLQYTVNLIQKYKNDALINISFAPHAPYTCSENLLRQVKKLADENDAIIQIHLSETQWEYEHFSQKYNCTPVEYLNQIEFFGGKTLAAHCVHLSENDIEIMASHQVGVAHNPECNMKLASGRMPLEKLWKAGIHVGLGTDGTASNNNLNLFAEMHTASLLHKFALLDASFAGARDMFEMATIGGAKALNLDSQIGSIEKGKKADILLIDFNKFHLTPIYNIYSHLVYALNSSDVHTVMIDGQIVYENHNFTNLDESKIIDEINKIGIKIAANQEI